MENFHIKSIILGIGIGVILTSMIGWIYAAGDIPKQMSREEIIQKAKEYGLTEKSIINSEPVKSDTVNVTVTLTVKRGETSGAVADNLLAKGLISDKTLFVQEIENRKLSSKINIGDFQIKKGTSLDDIISTITTDTP